MLFELEAVGGPLAKRLAMPRRLPMCGYGFAGTGAAAGASTGAGRVCQK